MKVRVSVTTVTGLCLIGLCANAAQAQSWADQLFETRSHDFGFVARNGKYEHGFVIHNRLNRRIHIVSATPSCSVCTIARPEKDWIEPGETAVLKASLNTRNVIGNKDVSITVTFDQPSYAQTRLQLKCFSRSDIVLSDNEVALGVVKRGNGVTKTVNIEYAGNSDWRIDGATSTNPAIETELVETHRGGGLVGYKLTVKLSPDASPGAIHDRITLGVNDAYNKSGLEVPVSGNVQAEVSLSASILDIGRVAPGSTTTKQVLVRGVRPFRITSIDGGDGPFVIEKSEDSKQLHILTVTLKAGSEPADLSQEFAITTDMNGEAPLKLTVSAKLMGKPSQTAN